MGQRSKRLTVDGISHPVRFSTFDTPWDTVAGYRIHLFTLSPSCPKESTTQYTIDIGLTPLDHPRRMLFINHVKVEDRQRVSGAYCAHLCVDFPTFRFNAKQRILSGRLPEITDSLQIFLGSGLYMAPEGYGSGIASMLFGISSLPWSNGSTNNDLHINSFDSDGAVSMQFKEKNITLAVGNRTKKYR